MFRLLHRTISNCQLYHSCVSDPTVRVVQMFATIRCFVAFIFSQFPDRLRLFEVRGMQQIQGLRERWSCEQFGDFVCCELHEMDELGAGNVCSRFPQIFQESRSYLKILGAGKLIWRPFHFEDPQKLCATVQKFSRHDVLAPGIWLPLVYEMLRGSEV